MEQGSKGSKDTLRIERWTNIARWVLLALYPVGIFLRIDDPNSVATMILIFGFVFVFLHAPRQYGWKATIIFVLLAFVVSTAFEDLSIHTGFPFGPYHYNSVIGNIDQVPFAVGLVYIAVGYFSWCLGTLILNHADRHLDSTFNKIALPVVSTFIMCQFDLVIDPSTSTYQGGWTWHEGGGFFGVPLVNFLGWYLVCYIYMQVFTLYLARQQRKLPNRPELRSKQYWLQPILFYLMIGAGYVVQYVYRLGDMSLITDPAGNAWAVNNLYETAVIVMLFTMLYSAVLALVSLFRSRTG
ncbi:MAG: carotenoid biosynthesis protein [Coriobacteriales bacterium]|jgi:putative membrane protein|nr:carotenoid biosynthesis protein [Coriobacteriales bacterium]